MELNQELRKEILQKIAISLLNNIKYNSKKIYCNEHAIEKANSIEESLYKNCNDDLNAYTDPAIINYITSKVLSKTNVCKIKIKNTLVT